MSPLLLNSQPFSSYQQAKWKKNKNTRCVGDTENEDSFAFREPNTPMNPLLLNNELKNSKLRCKYMDDKENTSANNAWMTKKTLPQIMHDASSKKKLNPLSFLHVIIVISPCLSLSFLITLHINLFLSNHINPIIQP
jgi:hypothetical protein